MNVTVIHSTRLKAKNITVITTYSTVFCMYVVLKYTTSFSKLRNRLQFSCFDKTTKDYKFPMIITWRKGRKVSGWNHFLTID